MFVLLLTGYMLHVVVGLMAAPVAYGLARSIGSHVRATDAVARRARA